MFDMQTFKHEIRNRLYVLQDLVHRLYLSSRGKSQKRIEDLILDAQNMLGGMLSFIEIYDNLTEDLHFDREDLQELVNKVISSWQYFAEARNIDIRVEMESQPGPQVLVEISKHHLLLAISNIVHNAIKYSLSRRQGRRRYVLIRGRSVYKHLTSGYELSVSNIGIGIDPEELQNIFVNRDRGNLSGGNDLRSSGYGLAFARDVIEIHHGSIEVSSQPASPRDPESEQAYLTIFKVWLPFNQPTRSEPVSRIEMPESEHRSAESVVDLQRINALYFPYINVPDGQWFNHILLYWDKVSSIVPTEFVFDPELFSPHMRNLVAAGLVDQIMPGSYIYKIPKFEEAFLEYVDRRLLMGEFSRPMHTINLHLEKMGNIADELVKRRLARRSDSNWYLVDRWVGDAFMAYLASTLGLLDDIQAAPVTDDLKSLQILDDKEVLLRQSNSVERARVRHQLLEEALPLPDGPIDIDSILYFKNTYGNLRADFRNYIEGACIEIANIRDDLAKQEKITLTKHEIKDKVKDITDAMRSRWQRISLGSLIPIIGAGTALIAEDRLDHPIVMTTLSFSLVAAIYQAYEGYRQYQQVLSHPLAYAARVRGHF